MTAAVNCMGCGGLVPDITGPTHEYMESSPGCWQAYGEVLGREYSDPASQHDTVREWASSMLNGHD